jgi:hypothetical protein
VVVGRKINFVAAHTVLYPSSDTSVSSPNIQAIKSRRMRWVGHVACMGKSRGAFRVLVGNPREDMGMDGRMGAWIGLMWFRDWTGGRLL